MLLLDSVRVVVRSASRQDLLADALRPEARLDHPTRNVAWTEARKLNFTGQASEGFVLRACDVGLVDLDCELDLVTFDDFG